MQAFLVTTDDALAHAEHGLVIQFCGVFAVFAAPFYFLAEKHMKDLAALFSVLYMKDLKNAILF